MLPHEYVGNVSSLYMLKKFCFNEYVENVASMNMLKMLLH